MRAAGDVFGELGMPMPLTVAEATRSPNLLVLQRAAEAQAAGPTLVHLHRRKLTIQDDILASHRPELTGIEPDIVFDAGSARLLAVRRRLDEEMTDLERRRPAGLEAADRPAVGAALRERASELQGRVREQFSQRATKLGLNDSAVEFPFEGLQAGMREAFVNQRSRFAEGAVHPTIWKIINGGRPPGADPTGPVILGPTGQPLRQANAGNLTFEDMQFLRRELNDETSRAAASGDRGTVRQLIQARKLFDSYFESVDPTNASPELVAEWRQFRADYKREVIDRFDKGTAYKVLRPGRKDEYQVADEKVADAFIGSNKGIRDFMGLYGNDAEALMGLRSAIIDRARLSGGVIDRDGNLNGRALANWVRKNPWLDDVPAVKAELESVVTASAAFSQREASLNARRALIERSRLTTALGGDPDEMLTRGLRDTGTARTLLRTARETGTEDALRAAVWSRMERDLDVKPGELAEADRLRKWMERNQRSLKILMEPEHVRHINAVYKGLDSITQLPLPGGTSEAVGPLDQVEQAIGSGVPQISSRVFAAQSGRVGYRYMAVDGLSRFINRLTKNRQEALLQEALFNPELARDMYRLSRAVETVPALEKRMNGWLFTMGLNVASEQEWLRAPGLEE